MIANNGYLGARLERGMGFRLACDTCEFDEGATAERSAYTVARDHERAYPDHFVRITER